MSQYQRKPDVVDAWQFDPNGTPPSWLQTAINYSAAFMYSDRLDVNAPDGMQSANVGDYVTHDPVTYALGCVSAAAFAVKWEAIP